MTAPTYDLGRLHGGLRLPGHKSQTTSSRIQNVPVPAQLVLPISQHVGEAAQPLVGIGEHVLKGQLLADTGGALGAPVHAPSSGKVAPIEPRPVSRRLGDNAPCIIIDCDGEDRPAGQAMSAPHFTELSPDALTTEILRGGIVGLGGAVFPTAQKLLQAISGRVEFLILNGVECEPYISCDDMLMREHATAVLVGAQILMQALQIDTCYVAVESDKSVALQSLLSALNALDDTRIVLKQIPTIYPSGGEDQLVQLVTNREVPTHGLPTDVGCLVQNVGTAAAIHDWIVDHQPLISRVTTVTGDGIRTPMNVRARIGTSVADIVEFTGGYAERAEHLIIGGPLTGKSISTDRVPLEKATNSILVVFRSSFQGNELPCIRCGDCAAVCPVQLQPQQLFWHASADDENKLRQFGLTDCIECGCCDLVCPSHLPLTASFRTAKARIRELQDEKARAERARRRFEARTRRLQQEQRDRELQLQQQKDNAIRADPAAIAEILKRKKNSHEDE